MQLRPGFVRIKHWRTDAVRGQISRALPLPPKRRVGSENNREQCGEKSSHVFRWAKTRPRTCLNSRIGNVCGFSFCHDFAPKGGPCDPEHGGHHDLPMQHLSKTFCLHELRVPSSCPTPWLSQTLQVSNTTTKLTNDTTSKQRPIKGTIDPSARRKASDMMSELPILPHPKRGTCSHVSRQLGASARMRRQARGARWQLL